MNTQTGNRLSRWIIIAALLLCSTLPAVADGLLLTSSITDAFVDQRYWTASDNFNAGLTFTQDPWSSDAYYAQRQSGNACEGWISYKTALGKKITGATLTCAPFGLPVKMQVKLDDGTWADLASIPGAHEEVTSGWTWTRDSYGGFSADEVRIYVPAGDPWNYPLIDTLGLTVSNEITISSSVVDTLVDQRYWNASSNFNAGLPYTQDPWSSDPYYAQRLTGNGSEGWITYKAATGKKITGSAVTCAPFGLTVKMQMQLTDGTWIDLTSSSHQEVTNGWTWTKDSYSGFSASAVRVYTPAADPWNYPLIDTVELTVIADTEKVIDSSIVDTLVDQRYWYASSNVNAGLQFTQDPWSSDRYYAQRQNTSIAWISYKAATGKKFTAIRLTTAPFALPAKMQTKLSDGTWAELASLAGSHQSLTDSWTWTRDSYGGFLADEVRVYMAAASPWSNPLIDTVELTVAAQTEIDSSLVDTSIVDTLVDQRYWNASSNVCAGLEFEQDPWSSDAYYAQRLSGSTTTSEGWFSYKVTSGKQFTGATLTCALLGLSVKMQIKLDDGTWADLAVAAQEEVTGAWTWTRYTYGCFSASEVRVYIPAGNPWGYPLIDTVELTIAAGTVLSSSVVDSLADLRYWNDSNNVNAGLQSNTDPWLSDTYYAQRLNGSATTAEGWISYVAATGKKLTGARVAYAPFGLPVKMQARLDDGTWGDLTVGAHDVVTNAWTWNRDNYSCFLVDAVRVYVPAGNPYNYPLVETVEVTVGSPTILSTSTVDTLLDQRYWYASNNFNAGLQSNVDPWTSDAYYARRLSGSATTSEGWISYKATVGKEFTGARLTAAPFGLTVKMQKKLADGAWADLTVGTHDVITNAWSWTRDNYTGFAADEIRVYTPSGNPYNYPLVETVELTVTSKAAVSCTIGAAKEKPLGTFVSVTGSITAISGTGSLYIEASDRSSGIRVDKTSHGYYSSDVGKVVTVTGNVSADSSTYELFLAASQITSTGTTNVLLPLSMTNRAAGGGSLTDGTGNGQIGVTGGTGLNNIGLLVLVSGWTSGGNASGFTLTDGSGVPLQVALAGAGTRYDGRYYTVTGISSIGADGGRVIKVRSLLRVQ